MLEGKFPIYRIIYIFSTIDVFANHCPNVPTLVRKAQPFVHNQRDYVNTVISVAGCPYSSQMPSTIMSCLSLSSASITSPLPPPPLPSTHILLLSHSYSLFANRSRQSSDSSLVSPWVIRTRVKDAHEKKTIYFQRLIDFKRSHNVTTYCWLTFPPLSHLSHPPATLKI